MCIYFRLFFVFLLLLFFPLDDYILLSYLRLQILILYYIYIYIYIHHKTCESTYDTLTSSAANQGDNTVSVTQGGTATPGATKQLLPPDRVFKRNIYLYIDKIN